MTQSYLIPLVVGLSITTGVLAIFVLGSLRPKLRQRIVDVAVIALIGYVIFYNVTKQSPGVEPSTFYRSVNIDPLRSLALQTEGRVKSFDSFARTMMRYVSGPHRIAGQDAAFTYMDMMLRPEAYQNADIIYVKKKQIRSAIADQLARVPDVPMSVLDSFRETGLISPTLLREPVVSALLGEMERDLIRTVKPANEIRSAQAISRPETLSRNLRIIPPPGGDVASAWYLGEDVWGQAPQDDFHAGMNAPRPIPGLDPELRDQITQTWNNLTAAWKRLDATEVNEHTGRLAVLLRTVAPSVYPDLEKLQLENWYFRTRSMAWLMFS